MTVSIYIYVLIGFKKLGLSDYRLTNSIRILVEVVLVDWYFYHCLSVIFTNYSQSDKLSIDSSVITSCDDILPLMRIVKFDGLSFANIDSTNCFAN